MSAANLFVRSFRLLVLASAFGSFGCAEDHSADVPGGTVAGSGTGGGASGGDTGSGGSGGSVTGTGGSGGDVTGSGGDATAGTSSSAGGSSTGGDTSSAGTSSSGGTPYVIEPGQLDKVELEVTYKPNATKEDVQPEIHITNKILTSVLMNQLEVRYYVTLDGEAVNAWNLAVSSASIPDPVKCCFVGLADKVVLELVTMDAPVTGADHYVKMTFTTDDSVFLRLTDTIELKLANYTNDPIDQTNDYSYSAFTDFTVWDHITIYKEGTLIYGVEPQ